jgi:hypothetical protein
MDRLRRGDARPLSLVPRLVIAYEGDFDNMPKRLDGMRQSLAAIDKLIAAAASA